MSYRERLPETSDYPRTAVAVNAVVSVVVALGIVWWANGFSVATESLYRVSPSASEGVGADWVAGNTVPALDFLVALIHAADVIMGVFILFMVFLHWGAFRRLASRMRQPGESRSEEVVADGGTDSREGGDGE